MGAHRRWSGLVASALVSVLGSSILPGQETERILVQLSRGDYTAARAAVDSLRTANPTHVQLPYLAGRVAFAEHDVPGSIRELEKAAELDNGNATVHYWLGCALAEAAKTASKLKQPFLAKRVMREWEEAVRLEPRHVDARSQLVAFYAVVPGFLGGSKEKARAQIVEIERVNAFRAALARGSLLEVEGKSEEELSAYREAIRAAPDSGAAHFALGAAYARTGHPSEAFKALDTYARAHPDDRWSLYHAGRYASLTGTEMERGTRELTAFLATPPLGVTATARAQAYYRLGDLHEKMGARELAQAAFRAALTSNPKHAEAKKRLRAMGARS